MRGIGPARATACAAALLAGCLAGPTPADDPDARAAAPRCSATSGKFIVLPTPRGWQGAETACRDAGGDLAMVRSAADRDQVRALIDSTAWLGTVDLDHDGVWHHIDGSDASPDWAPDEPSLAPDDECVAIHRDGKDYAESCTRSYAAVCGCGS